MSERMTFAKITQDSRRFSRDEYVGNFGGIIQDVLKMFQSDAAKNALEQAEKYITQLHPTGLPEHIPVRGRLPFGEFDAAPELARGEVAAVDGTLPLPMQKFTAGQAICAGIGSISYLRRLESSVHGYTSTPMIQRVTTTNEYIEMLEQAQMSGINPSAYMRYYEMKHAATLQEPYIFIDGTLIYEWLANQDIGRAIYKSTLSKKQTIGVIKNLKDNVRFQFIGSVLRSGEYVIIESVYTHLSDLVRKRKDTRGELQWNADSEFVTLSQNLFRGLFKPRDKFFGFECHKDYLPEMLRIMAADCQMNQPGHEIPYLLNIVDKEIQSFFRPNILKDEIAYQLSKESESLFFMEGDEHSFR